MGGGAELQVYAAMQKRCSIHMSIRGASTAPTAIRREAAERLPGANGAVTG